jgi:hypothetical protein
VARGASSFIYRPKRETYSTSTFLIIIVLLLAFGGGGGYYGYNRYGSRGLGLVIVIFIILWFLGVLV